MAASILVGCGRAFHAIDSDFLLEFLYETEEERHQSFLPVGHAQKDTFHLLG